MNARLQILLETLRKLLRRNALRRAERVLQKARPEDVASVLRSLDPTQQLQIFELLPSDDARSERKPKRDGNFEGRKFESRGEGKSYEGKKPNFHDKPRKEKAPYVAKAKRDAGAKFEKPAFGKKKKNRG